MNRSKFALSWAIRGGLLIWLVVHFTLSLLFCFPSNPLKDRYQPLLYETIGTYFAQNWSLFAPNPVNVNQSLLVRCLSPDEDAKFGSDHALPSDGWHDITMPLFAAHQRNRFAVYDRMSRPQTNIMKAFLNGGQGLAPLQQECRDGNKAACELYEVRLKRVRDLTGPILGRIASSFCREVRPISTTSRVAIRLRQVDIVPWSRRSQTSEPKSTDFEVGTYPIDSTLPLANVYAEVP